MEPAPHRERQGRVVGRARSVQTLAALPAAARAGRGRSAVVLGEAGIGKTTLVQDFAQRSAADGLATVWCWCSPGDPVPYLPWRPLLRYLALPEAVAVTGGPDGAERRNLDRHRMFAAILDGLESAGRDRPVLVVMEDVHWADAGSLALLRVVVDALPGLPACLVATARDDPTEVPDAAATALRDLPSGVLRLQLDPLGVGEVAELLSELTGRPTDPELAARVRERTGGNPFLVVEVGRGLTEAAPDTLPRGARELVARRLDRLSPTSVAALNVAAASGEPIDVSLVAEVIGAPEADTVDLLDTAVRARLLAAGTDAGLRFVHALVSDVITAGTAAAERARLHEAIAVALERRGHADPGTVARHWSLAVGPAARERAAYWSLVQAREARRQLGFEQAVTAYQRGLTAVGEDRLTLLLELAETQRLAGDVAGARATFLDVAQRARDEGRAAELSRAALGLGGGVAGFEVALRDDEQVELLRESLATLPTSEGVLRAAVGARLSVALAELAPDRERIALAEEAVALGRRVGDTAVRVATLAAYCDAIAGPAHVAARLDAAVEMRAIADAAADHVGRLLARRLVVVALSERGELTAADAEGAAYARIADRLGVPHYRWLPLIWRARHACLHGDLTAAGRAADEAAELGERAGSVNARYMAAVVRWQIHRVAGTMGAHQEELFAAFADILDVPSTFGAQADCLVAAGKLDEAARLVHAACAIGFEAMPCDSEWLAGVFWIGAAAIRLGNRDAAEAVYAALTPYPGVFVVEGLAAAVSGVTDLMLGKLAAFLDDPAAARAHLDAAYAIHRRTGSPVLTARASAELRQLDGLRSHSGSQPGGSEGVFRRAGRLWQVTFRGQSAVVPDSKGMGDLAALLAAPGRDVHVLDLVDTTGGARATAAPAGETIDPQARAAYRSRLHELEREVSDAEADADLGRAERLRTERDFIAAELSAALGLGGRTRTAADPVERARKAVGMRIGTALRAIEAVHRPLARHLRLAVRTGRFCTYQPESPVRWHG